MTALTIEELSAAIGAGTATIGGIGAAWKWGVPKFLQMRSRARMVHELHAVFGEAAATTLKRSLTETSAALQRFAAKQAVITRRAKLGMYLCDETGQCRWVNEPMAEMFGMDREAMMGFGWLLPVLDREAVHVSWKWSVENDTPYQETYRVQPKGKEPFDVHTEAFRHYAEDGKTVLFWMGYVERVEPAS